MGTPAKPDASFASIRLNRRNNHNGGAPLSQVMGKPIRRKSRQAEKSERKASIKPEPATDDEPESSSNDECELSDDHLSAGLGDTRRIREPAMTLQEKRDANDVAAPRERGRITRSSQRRGNDGSGSQMGQKRGNSSPNTEDEALLWRRSQNSKRQRTYSSSRTNRHGSSSNVASSQLQEGPRSADPTPVNSQAETKAESNTREMGEGFKFPVEVDLGSPLTHSGTQENNEVKPTTLSSSSLAASSEDLWLFDDDGSGLSTPLSSASSSFMLELSQVDDAFAAEWEANQSICPVCKKQVDPDRLETFLSQPRQRIRDQIQFCESHQQTFAEQEWREKGYPSIDWETFHERIQGHLAELESLLVPDNSSFYRNVLVSALKSGNAKNFRLTLAGDGLETVACGYYGTRGASEM